MSPRPSRSNLLDVLPGFTEEEEHTGIHVRPQMPTLSMPPFPPANDLVFSSTVAARLAESGVEEPMQTIADEEADELEIRVITQASLRPAAILAPERAAPPSTFAFVLMAFAIIAMGFVAGFTFTR